VLGGADALAEQPHPILLLRANDLGFRAMRLRSRPVPTLVRDVVT
jgi:hypothetical protein